tara:strand:- start:370 stop:840 length:471 start_codon:yes stop_codon:yes gene_type:complete
MNQAKKYELMSDYIDGNMTECELEDFNKILADNSELEKEIEEVKSVLEKIKSIKSLKLSDNFDAKLQKAIKLHNRKQSLPHKVLNIFDNPVFATVGAVAAAVVLVVVTTIFFSTKSTNISNIHNDTSNLSYVDAEEELNEYEPDIEMTGNSGEDSK